MGINTSSETRKGFQPSGLQVLPEAQSPTAPVGNRALWHFLNLASDVVKALP